jgi:hypothetical protein
MRKLVLSLIVSLLAIGALAQDSVPLMVNFQGMVRENAALITGEGYFRFAIIDNSIPPKILWSNDGSFLGEDASNMPTYSVLLQVKDGIYSVPLGDTDIPNMTSIPESVFRDNKTTYLRVWFNTSGKTAQLLSPDVQFLSVPYAYRAASVSGTSIADNSITMGKMARESVGPQHEGRDNTIVSTFFDITSNAAFQLVYTVPLGKTFILTDVFITESEIGPLWKFGGRLGTSGTPDDKIHVDARSAGLANFQLSLKAGVPFASSDSESAQIHLGQFTTGDTRSVSGTICGFEFSNSK